MFNIGSGEILIISLVLLIFVGPEQLPAIMRKVGSGISQARKMSESMKNDFMGTLNQELEEKKEQAPSSGGQTVSPVFDASEDTVSEKSDVPDLVEEIAVEAEEETDEDPPEDGIVFRPIENGLP